MARTYNDPVKAKAREKLRDFIARNILNRKKPKEVTVACFPGAEVDGEEALEVKQVYDALGIPRKNIIGIESNHEKAERLRRANLGIELVEADALDFFVKYPYRLDSIHLDYTGPMTVDSTLVLEAIASRQVLDHNGVLATAFLGKRETKDLQSLMFRRHLNHTTSSNLLNSLVRSGDVSAEINKWRALFMETQENEPDKKRMREGNTLEIHAIFRGGRIGWPVSEHIFSHHPEAQSLLEAMIKRKPEELDINLDVFGKEPAFFDETYISQVQKLIYKIESSKLAREIYRSGMLNERDSLRLINLLQERKSGTYVPKEIERYYYVSNDGSPMLLDFFSFRPLPAELQDCKDVIDYDLKEGVGVMNRKNKPVGQYLDKLHRIVHHLQTLSVLQLPHRIHLGSSYEPPKRKERITREQAVDLLRDGVSTAEIVDCYRGFSIMQLAALKAHYVTMGKDLKPN